VSRGNLGWVSGDLDAGATRRETRGLGVYGPRWGALERGPYIVCLLVVRGALTERRKGTGLM